MYVEQAIALANVAPYYNFLGSTALSDGKQSCGSVGCVRTDPCRLYSLGKFLSLEEVASLVRPSQSSQKVVRNWLQSHGVKDCQSVTTEDFPAV